MHMETRNRTTAMPLFKVKGEKFIYAVQMKLQGKCGVMGMIIDGKIMEI